jgi:tetratricopeptide (TPR) repeat protein
MDTLGESVTRISDRQISIAIRVVALCVVVLAVYLGYSAWTISRTQAATTSAGRAIENLRSVVTASPGDAGARVRLAEALASSGDITGSIEQFQAALKIQEDLIPALAGLGSIAMKQKKWTTAEGYWKKIIGLLDKGEMASKDARLDNAYYGLGVVCIELKRYEEAVVNLKEALRIRPAASDTHYMLSVAYRELGYPDKQKEELLITLAFEPANAQANYDVGMLALKEGDLGTAAEFFRMSADKAPEGVDLPQKELDALDAQQSAALRFAEAQELRETNADKALAQARIAAAIDPENAEAVRLVAVLWEEKGSNDRALNAYRRFAELRPNDEIAAEAIKRLTTNAK